MADRLKILVDTREQRPYQFGRYPVEVVRGTLHTGDYSIPGQEARVAIERKSLADLIGCITTGRDRFKRELERSMDIERFIVIVEALEQAVTDHAYRGRVHPHAVLGSLRTWVERYGCRLVWAGNRRNAEGVVFDTLAQWQQDQARRAPEELFG